MTSITGRREAAVSRHAAVSSSTAARAIADDRLGRDYSISVSHTRHRVIVRRDGPRRATIYQARW